MNAVDAREKQTPLHYTAERENVVVAKVLIQSSADVNILSPKYGTALHKAAA